MFQVFERFRLLRQMHYWEGTWRSDGFQKELIWIRMSLFSWADGRGNGTCRFGRGTRQHGPSGTAYGAGVTLASSRPYRNGGCSPSHNYRSSYAVGVRFSIGKGLRKCCGRDEILLKWIKTICKIKSFLIKKKEKRLRN